MGTRLDLAFSIKLVSRFASNVCCLTEKMIADALTKALALEQFTRLRDGIMMPKIIADRLGGIVRITIQQQINRRPLGGAREAAD